MENKRVAIIGSSLTDGLFSHPRPKEAFFFESVFYAENMSLISFLSENIDFDYKELGSVSMGMVSRELKKESLDQLIKSRPDVILVDFVPDLMYGVYEFISGGYVTAIPEWEKSDLVFKQKLQASETYDEFLRYIFIWKESVKKFFDLCHRSFPEAKIIDHSTTFVASARNSAANQAWKQMDDYFRDLGGEIITLRNGLTFNLAKQKFFKELSEITGISGEEF